jgi:hypothetical protein
VNASIDVIAKIHRLMTRADRKEALRWQLSEDRDAALVSAGLSKGELEAAIAEFSGEFSFQK